MRLGPEGEDGTSTGAIISIGDALKVAKVMQKKVAASERSELIRYFHERAKDKAGKPYRASYIAMRLSHLSMRDLYSFKSDLIDRERTFRPYEGKDGKMVLHFNWGKAFWGMLKVEK